MTMLLSFTFNPQRESDFHMALVLAKEHFPGAFRQGFSVHQVNQRGLRITCTSDEFCKWMVERDQMGFVNRMHQLNLQINYSKDHHFPRSELTSAQLAAMNQHKAIQPIDYVTPLASGVGG